VSKLSEEISFIKDNIKNLFNFISNIDNNIKILINKISSLERKVESLEGHGTNSFKAQTPPLMPSVTTPDTLHKPSLKPALESLVKIGDGIDIKPKYKKPEVIDIVKEDVAIGPTNARNVFQKISFHDGRPVYLADVLITDDSGKTIKQTRTNPKGKWIAPLHPGEYTIHIKKNADDEFSKLPLNLKFKIEIPFSEERDYELESPQVPHVY
jgi:hypothetical protein